MHLAGSGRVIVRLSGMPEEGQILCDREGTRVAKVVEVIGPTAAPYASASPLTNSAKRYVGRKVFAQGRPAGGRRGS